MIPDAEGDRAVHWRAGTHDRPCGVQSATLIADVARHRAGDGLGMGGLHETERGEEGCESIHRGLRG